MSKFNFFDRILIATTDFTGNKVSWSFNSTGILLLNESTTASDVVQYSFNGTDVHGDLRPGTPSAGLSFDNRTESSVYFRLETAGSGVLVRAEAWGAR